MEPKKYLIVFEDFGLKIVSKIEDDFMQDAINGRVVIIDITGAKDPRELAFPGSEIEWWSINDDSENSD